MDIFFELIDTEASNVLGTFDSLNDALDLLRKFRTNAQFAMIRHLVLVADLGEDQPLTQVANGERLLMLLATHPEPGVRKSIATPTQASIESESSHINLGARPSNTFHAIGDMSLIRTPASSSLAFAAGE